MRILKIEIPVAPVSLQAGRDDKEPLKAEIRRIIAPYKLFLTGEVRLNIDWMIHDRLRYETDTAPDVDNILKPLIDSLCGPEGLLIDDCQIQRVNCGWIDWNRDDQMLHIEIEYFDDELIESRNLFFIQFAKGLCFPFQKDLPVDTIAMLANHLADRLKMRDELVSRTGDYHVGFCTMPIQRFFHRTRIHGFDVISLDDYLEESKH